MRIKLECECDVQGSSQICYCSAQNVVSGIAVGIAILGSFINCFNHQGFGNHQR